MKFEQRTDGLWLLFPTGEEAGPFVDRARAQLFLDHVQSLQR